MAFMSQHIIPSMYPVSRIIHSCILSHFSLSLGIHSTRKSTPSPFPASYSLIFCRHCLTIFLISCSCYSLVPDSCILMILSLFFVYFSLFSSSHPASRLEFGGIPPLPPAVAMGGFFVTYKFVTYKFVTYKFVTYKFVTMTNS